MKAIQDKTATVIIYSSIAMVGLFMAGYQIAKYYIG